MLNKCWKLCLVFVFSLLLFSSCGCFQKFQRTRTITTETIKIDTVIKIKTDTIFSVKTVTLHDTAILENTYARTVSYYDTSVQRIVLKLQSKNFSVPIVINHTSTIKQTKTKKEVDPMGLFILFGLIALSIIILLIIKHLK